MTAEQRCPECNDAMTLVAGRDESWCNRCMAFRGVGSSPSDAPPTRADDFVRAAGENTVSLMVVLPVVLVGAAIAALLFWLGMREAGAAVITGTFVIAWLLW